MKFQRGLLYTGECICLSLSKCGDFVLSGGIPLSRVGRPQVLIVLAVCVTLTLTFRTELGFLLISHPSSLKALPQHLRDSSLT